MEAEHLNMVIGLYGFNPKSLCSNAGDANNGKLMYQIGLLDRREIWSNTLYLVDIGGDKR